MPALITPELMEETWQSVATMSPKELQKRQGLCGKEQQELTGFVLAFTSDLRPDAMGLALYVQFVVIEAFRRTKIQFRKIKPGKIQRTWTDNFGFINDLRQAGYTSKPFQLNPGGLSEPAALQYVVDALTEQDEEDVIEFDENDFWHMLQVLKTVIDCMHDAPRTR